MPFDDDYDDQPKPKKGLKINPNNSILAAQQKTSPQQFEKDADEAFSRKEDYKKRGYDLAVKFKQVLQDKVLPQNKTALALDIEREVLEGFIQLAEDINTDQNEIEGQGSVAVLAVLLKCMLLQRDRLNAVEFRLETLEKESAKLAAKLASIPNKEEK